MGSCGRSQEEMSLSTNYLENGTVQGSVGSCGIFREHERDKGYATRFFGFSVNGHVNLPSWTCNERHSSLFKEEHNSPLLFRHTS